MHQFHALLPAILLLAVPMEAHGQDSAAVTFIRLNPSIGFVIDAAENEACRCVPYIDKQRFRDASLLLLPDSVVRLRIRLMDQELFRDVVMRQSDGDILFRSAGRLEGHAMNSVQGVLPEEKEADALAAMAEGRPSRFTGYENFTFPAVRSVGRPVRSIMLMSWGYRQPVILHEGTAIRVWTMLDRQTVIRYSGPLAIVADSMIRVGGADIPIDRIFKLKNLEASRAGFFFAWLLFPITVLLYPSALTDSYTYHIRMDRSDLTRRTRVNNRWALTVHDVR